MRLFGEGRYFECHDALEDVWSGVRGPSRDFFQGLIQVAVALHHLSNGNSRGATSLIGRALKRFERYPPRYFGLDLASLRTELVALGERIASGRALTPDDLPQWRFKSVD